MLQDLFISQAYLQEPHHLDRRDIPHVDKSAMMENLKPERRITNISSLVFQSLSVRAYSLTISHAPKPRSTNLPMNRQQQSRLHSLSQRITRNTSLQSSNANPDLCMNRRVYVRIATNSVVNTNVTIVTSVIR